jgi:undecaprenyl-diphosphatase
MWAGAAGSVICNYMGGHISKRPVPDMPAIAENLYYFPSANATCSMMFYGFIIYFVFRTFDSLRIKLNTAFILVPLIVLIGFSRIYLGVYHYTDVQAGWLLGALWLIISMGMAEYLEYRHPHEHIHAIPKKVKAFIGAFAALGLVMFMFFGMNEYSKFVEPLVHLEKHVVSKPADVIMELDLPVFTESLFGDYREPVNIIISTANQDNLIKCMEASGWYKADEQDFKNVMKRIKAIITGENYYNSPVVPSFWRNAIQDIAFEMPALKKGIAEMHWVRFWNTGIVTAKGEMIFAGCASYNISLGSKFTHRIKPEVDEERSLLQQSLLKKGALKSNRLVRPHGKPLKKKFLKKHYYSDGMVDVINLNQCD